MTRDPNNEATASGCADASNKNGIDRLSVLPDELQRHILGFLPYRALVQASRVNKSFHGVYHSLTLWKKMGAKSQEDLNKRMQNFYGHTQVLLCEGIITVAMAEAMQYRHISDSIKDLVFALMSMKLILPQQIEKFGISKINIQEWCQIVGPEISEVLLREPMSRSQRIHNYMTALSQAEPQIKQDMQKKFRREQVRYRPSEL